MSRSNRRWAVTEPVAERPVWTSEALDALARAVLATRPATARPDHRRRRRQPVPPRA